jgi:IclR helix-turn-helix domain
MKLTKQSAKPPNSTHDRLPCPMIGSQASTPAPLDKNSRSHSQPSRALLDDFLGDPNFMTSLARGLLVLEALKRAAGQATLRRLSGETGLSQSAVRRCLYTLAKLGIIGAASRQGYRFSSKESPADRVNAYVVGRGKGILIRQNSALGRMWS